jgi:hypothetical protein
MRNFGKSKSCEGFPWFETTSKAVVLVPYRSAAEPSVEGKQ